MAFDVVSAALDTGSLLDRLGIPYAIGGGLASALYGEPRTTLDVDVAARVRSEHVDRLLRLAAPEFLVDRELFRDAIRDRRIFQMIHRATYTKVDVHVVPDDELHAAELERARWRRLAADREDEVRVATPEDVVIQKLIWFRKTDETSERQWRDVKGILKLRGHSMDFGYMRRWCESAGVGGLLDRAMIESGLRDAIPPRAADA